MDFNFKDIIKSKIEKLKKDFNINNLIEIVELILNDNFGIITGSICDCDKSKTKEFDLIIYEKKIIPNIFIQNKIIPCECVLCAGNLIDTLENEKYEEYYENIFQLKNLKRVFNEYIFRKPGSLITIGLSNNNSYDGKNNFFDNIFCFLITRNNKINKTQDYFNKNNKFYLYDFIYSLDNRNFTKGNYSKDNNKAIYFLNKDNNSYFEYEYEDNTILYLLNDILGFINNARMQPFNMNKYIKFDQIKIKKIFDI